MDGNKLVYGINRKKQTNIIPKMAYLVTIWILFQWGYPMLILAKLLEF